MTKDETEGSETADEDVEPRSLSSLFRRRRERIVDGKVIELSGRAYIDEWRSWWAHPGRLPTHGFDPATGLRYPISYPESRCPHCPRTFLDDAALARHVEDAHSGLLHRISKAVRRK